MTEHGVEFFEAVDFCFYVGEADAHFVGEFFLGCGLVGYEFVQRGIEQTDGYSVAVHSFEDAFEVTALHGQEFCECLTASFFVGGDNHFAHGFDAVAFEEHVFCAAQADTLCAEVACLLGVAGRVGVGAYEGFGVFRGEVHDCAEVAADFGFGGGYLTVVNFAGRTVERNPVAFVVYVATHFNGFFFVVYFDFACT